MRMRRKKHLEERLADCGDMIIYMDRADRNYQVKDNKELIDCEALFGNSNPVEMEIGCGKGQFICELAQRRPDVNYLAVEKSSNVVVDAAEKALSLGIKNVRFMRGGAEYLECFVPAGIVERIYLNFSCPFPKKSYASHRLTNRRFLAIYDVLLKPHSEIWQKTDNRNFFEFSLEEFSDCGWTLKNISLDLHANEPEDNIVTEYEKRFTELGMPIYRLEAYRK
ncbi:MAG: tRNA (guanosine(46)-N7)-methyltransferase TrmB [Ruminococcus sp.]|nr:tRNA (guanosine(46)-N7)-methyltransferase TrmB [Ruminococcus sp.]